MMQNFIDMFHMIIVLFAIVGGFYYLYGLAFIFGVVASRKSNAGKPYRGWLVVSLICLAAGLGMHFAVIYLKTGFYVPG